MGYFVDGAYYETGSNDPAEGWQYFSNGTAISPEGNYFYDGNMVYSGSSSDTGSSLSKALSGAWDLLTGKSSAGTGGQILGLTGVAGLLNSMFGDSSGGYAGYQGGIPQYTASRTQTPIPTTEAAPRRPGSGGITYFSPMTYTPVEAAAGGGIMSFAKGGYNLGDYSDGGRLLKGPGDGVSDSIPATIAGKRPARLADGEFVVPARIVSELGNGSTEAGARKLYAMMDRIKKARGKAKDIAADTKADKHLPA